MSSVSANENKQNGDYSSLLPLEHCPKKTLNQQPLARGPPATGRILPVTTRWLPSSWYYIAKNSYCSALGRGPTQLVGYLANCCWLRVFFGQRQLSSSRRNTSCLPSGYSQACYQLTIVSVIHQPVSSNNSAHYPATPLFHLLK